MTSHDRPPIRKPPQDDVHPPVFRRRYDRKDAFPLTPRQLTEETELVLHHLHRFFEEWVRRTEH